MRVFAIAEHLRNLKQQRLCRRSQAKQLAKQVELPIISPVITQLANMTFLTAAKLELKMFMIIQCLNTLISYTKLPLIKPWIWQTD